MLKFIIVLIVILFENVQPECGKPKSLADNEKECLEITTSVFERMSSTATGVFNMAKKKLGIDVEEEPLKCSYYLCILHNVKMVTESGILELGGIAEWIESHVPLAFAEEFKKHATQCVEAANKVADVPNCQKSMDFVKCLSEFNNCPMFNFP